MADADRLQTLAYACVQAAHDVEDTDTAAMLLESACRFLERSKPEVAALGTDVRSVQPPVRALSTTLAGCRDCHKCQLRFRCFVPISMGGELSLGFSWPLVGPGTFPGPGSAILGIGATRVSCSGLAIRGAGKG